jgi:hypothetical protein
MLEGVTPGDWIDAGGVVVADAAVVLEEELDEDEFAGEQAVKKTATIDNPTHLPRRRTTSRPIVDVPLRTFQLVSTSPPLLTHSRLIPKRPIDEPMELFRGQPNNVGLTLAAKKNVLVDEHRIEVGKGEGATVAYLPDFLPPADNAGEEHHGLPEITIHVAGVLGQGRSDNRRAASDVTN